MSKILFIGILLLFSCFNLEAQTDSTLNSKERITQNHSPRKATLLSAVFPGAGQVYNKKYWKLPVIYGGFGVAAYYLDDNLKNIKFYKANLLAELDTDSTTMNTTDFNASQLSSIVDNYKRWRDLSYISFGLIYALQIIDANVDANLLNFDVSDDLSLLVQPYANPTTHTAIGLSLTLKL